MCRSDMPGFRKTQTEIEAEQFWPGHAVPFVARGPYVKGDADTGRWFVVTSMGQRLELEAGDWVVLERYIMKPGIFGNDSAAARGASRRAGPCRSPAGSSTVTTGAAWTHCEGGVRDVRRSPVVRPPAIRDRDPRRLGPQRPIQPTRLNHVLVVAEGAARRTRSGAPHGCPGTLERATSELMRGEGRELRGTHGGAIRGQWLS